MNKPQTTTNKIRQPMMNRVKAAMLAVKQLIGFVPSDSVSYRKLCPKGAGAGKSKHEFSEQSGIGAKKFFRRSDYLRRAYSMNKI